MAEKKTSATTKRPAKKRPAAAAGDGAGTQSEPRDPEQIEAEIEQTREELGDTVAALAEKTDVKKQAKRKVEETKSAAQEKANETADAAKQAFHDAPEAAGEVRDRTIASIRDHPAPAVAVGVVLIAIVVLIRRKRR